MRLEMGMGSEVASLVGGGGSAISNCPPPAVPPHAAHRRPSLSLPVTPDASSSTAQRLLDRADNPAPMWDGPVRGVPRPLQDRLSDGMGEAAPPSTRPAQWAPLGSRASVPARRHSSSPRPPDHPSFAVLADTMGPVIGHPLRGVGHTALSGRVPLQVGGGLQHCSPTQPTGTRFVGRVSTDGVPNGLARTHIAILRLPPGPHMPKVGGSGGW